MNGRFYDAYFTPEERYGCTVDSESARFDETENGVPDDSAYRAYCAYCGFPILRGDEKLRVDATGDRIHRKCWSEYAEDNIDALCTALEEN